MQAKRNTTMETRMMPRVASYATRRMPRTTESGDSQERKPKEGLFEGLSFSQIAAGALAAVTSMLLASQIGIAGSVIGVAVGSVVATVTSQLYKRFLSASAEKLRGLHASEGGSDAESAQTLTSDVRCDGGQGESASARSLTPRIDEGRANVSDAVLQARAARTRKTRMQRRVVAVALASGLVAVGVSAALVSFATMGEGLGQKTTGVGFSTSQDQTSTAAPAQGSSTSSRGSSDENASAASSSSTDATSSSATSGSSASTGTSSTGTDGAASSGSTTSGSGSSGSSSGTTSGSSSGSAGSGTTSSGEAGSGTTTGTGSGSSSTTDQGSSSTGSTGSSASSTTASSAVAHS